MSESFSISCHQCRQSYWVGQAPNGSDAKAGYLYTAEARGIWLWLRAHEDHSLVFHRDRDDGQERETSSYLGVQLDEATGRFKVWWAPEGQEHLEGTLLPDTDLVTA